MMTVSDYPEWQRQLLSMGFTPAQIERANDAGIKGVPAAIDFLDDSRRSDSSDRTDFNLNNTYNNSNIQHTAPTFTSDPQKPSLIANARNSLDNINVSRLPADTSQQTFRAQERHPSSSVRQNNGNQDDELNRVLELSRKEQHDREMEQALRMSKQEAAPVTDRDPELIRAIEESLKDNDANNAERAVSWKSQGFNVSENAVRASLDEPVGLRNIGNTCYLNSLLQVYYYLPNFRRAIMSFRAPESAENPVFGLTATSNEDFVQTDHNQRNSQCNEAQVSPFRPTDDMTAEKTSESASDWARIPSLARDNPLDVEMEYPTTNLEIAKGQAGSEGMGFREAQKLSSSIAVATRGEASVSDKSDNRTERGTDAEKTSERHAIEFVIELQRLFAAMALGHDSCVDPTGVVRAMRDGEGNPIKIGTQQDASEFNHLFLDIVERGLRADQVQNAKNDQLCGETQIGDSNFGSPGSSSTDIVKDMFTLKFKQELQMCADGVNADGAATKTSEGETNCIIVDATTSRGRDLHNGLEDYVVARIEYSGRDGSCDNERLGVSGSEMTAEDATMAAIGAITKAERGAMVSSGDVGVEDTDGAMMVDVDMGTTSNGTPSCVLKSVWFTKLSPVVVMYLQRVRYIREKALAEKVYDKYEFGPNIALGRYHIDNRVAATRAREHVAKVRKERRRIVSMMRKYKNFPFVEGLPTHVGDADVDIDLDEDGVDYFTSGGRVRDRLLEALNPSSEFFSVAGLSPERVNMAVQTIEQVLEHDKLRYDTLYKELESFETEDQIYSGLDSMKYRLHAVLVHDGAPSGGHYWSFVRDWRAKDSELTWMKLSDSVVSRSSETEMLKWSVGGHGRASAYCLIYTVADFTECDDNIPDESRRLLPKSRVREVDNRNESKSNAQKERINHAVGAVSEMDVGVELKNQTW